jgi:LysM domain
MRIVFSSTLRGAVVVLALLVPTTSVRTAFAQQQGGSGQAGGQAGTSGSPSGTSGGGASTGTGGGGTPATGGGTPQAAPIYGGGVAPTPPGGVLGGGNVTSSSSRPKVGDETDHFDLGPKTSGGGTQFGAENGPVFLEGAGPGGAGSRRNAGGVVPNKHTVRKGDTLWDICDFYFQNPYQWPRIWSYNAQLQNPHWIYPGDQISLKGTGIALNETPQPTGNGGLIDRRRQVPGDTIFLRDQGFVDDKSDDNWGEITGAPVDKMFLSDFDDVYLRLAGNRDVKLGQELTIFRDIRSVPGGKVVQIQGTLRVNQWNPKERIARAQIVESLDVIERGARIGPIARKFIVSPPVRNEIDVRARILASVHQHNFYGQNAVIFIDKGEKEGLRTGNRLFIVRKGDAWRASLATEGAATRIALESDSPAAVERVPTPRNPAALPEEVVGELRVVSTRDHSATCVVAQARSEIELQDEAVARKGY